MNSSTRKRKRQTAAAGGLQSRQPQICLPSDLTDRLPSCAFSCIVAFTQQNYTPIDCASTSDIDFLCTNRSRTGDTIGVASLQCVASECAGQASNQVLLAAYNICDDVENAIPNTATVINATIRPVSTTAQSIASVAVQPPATPTTTPASPSATGAIVTGISSMTLSGTGMSVTVQIMMPSASSAQGPAPTMSEIGSNFMPEEMPSMNTGLSRRVIASTAAGASLAGVLFVALLFFFLRRRKQAKEDKAVWPKQISSPDTTTSQVSSFGMPQSNQPVQNKRRSFWRASIMPEEIGVAVSGRPGARQSSAAANATLGQMPPGIPAKHTGPTFSWPITCPPHGPAPPRPPRESVATIFDEDIEQQPNQPPRVSAGGAYFSLAEPAKSKPQKRTPQPLELERTRAVSPAANSTMPPGNSSTIPLTPTYDNGNFVITPKCPVVSNCIAAALASTIPLSTQGRLPMLSLKSAFNDGSARRNRLQKKLSFKRPPPAAQPVRQDSESTVFDIDTTPEELDRRLEAPARDPLYTIMQSPRSPVSNIRYPKVPDSAAISPQARQPAQPSYLFNSPSFAFIPKGIRPQRDTLSQGAPNFINTDSVSSDGRVSDYSIDWPVPPSGRLPVAQKSPASRLTRLANRATTESVYSQQRASEYRMSPNPQVGSTPTKSKTGDLFFKVEI